MEAKGSVVAVRFDGRLLTISRDGLAARLIAGGRQVTTFPVEQIAGINVSKPSKILNRIGEFTVLAVGAATAHHRGETRGFDPASVRFWSGTQRFEAIAKAVDD